MATKPKLGTPPKAKAKTSGSGGGKPKATPARTTDTGGGFRPPTVIGDAQVQPAKFDPTLLTDDQWVNQDATYLQTQAALQQALVNYGNGVDAQRSAYDIDNAAAVRQLGFQGGSLDSNGQWGGGQWNRTDVNTQSGRAFTDQANDFAARGMLQSSGYAQEDENLSRKLNGQLTANANARTAYMQGKSSDMLDQVSQTGIADTDARAAAIARRAQQAAAAAGRLSV